MEETHITTMPRAEEKGKLIQWAQRIYLAGVLLALIFVVPTAWFPFQVGKLAVFATALALSVVFFVVGAVRSQTLVSRLHGRAFHMALVVALLPLAYLLSLHFSVDKSVGFIGLTLETDTILFVLLGFSALLVSTLLFRTQQEVRSLLRVVFFSILGATLFQAIVVMFGTQAIPLQAFADRSANLVGKWNDFGLVLGILALWTLVSLEWGSLKNIRKILALVLLVVIVLLLGLIQFSVIWGLLCGFSLLFAGIAYISRPAGESKISLKNIPWYPLVFAAVAVLFLVFGSSINTNLSKTFPVSSLEVRPSYQSTLAVIQGSHLGVHSALVGTGPDTFSQEWVMHKPSDVNLSSFWNLDFAVGYSTLFTAFANVGLIGAMMWLLPFLLSLLALVRIFRSSRSREEKVVAGNLGVAVVYLWLCAALYVPSQNLLVLSFVLSGALIAYAYGAHTAAAVEGVSTRKKIYPLACAGLLVLLSLFVVYHVDRFAVGESYVNTGYIALNAGHIDDALKAATTADGYVSNNDALRLQVQAGLGKLQEFAASTTPSAGLQQHFTDMASSTVGAGLQAAARNPHDYRAPLLLGQVYDYLASLNIQNADQLARLEYAAAAKLNPEFPAIPLLQARLEASHGTLKATQGFIDRALTLKQNYTDAILFVVQFNVAHKDLNGAILAAQAAVRSAPGVASIWFELGLLYYTGGDAKDATLALEQAVTLQKDYANAKYFLGLSYYAQHRATEGIQQFKDLVGANPDNKEVALILANMEAGKDPFASAQPPVTNHPENRATAPVSE